MGEEFYLYHPEYQLSKRRDQLDAEIDGEPYYFMMEFYFDRVCETVEK